MLMILILSNIDRAYGSSGSICGGRLEHARSLGPQNCPKDDEGEGLLFRNIKGAIVQKLSDIFLSNVKRIFKILIGSYKP